MELAMTMTDDTTHAMQRIIQVRVPTNLANAMDLAAKRRFSSVSDVVRESVATSLRAAGLLTE
jgi:Arc/MetJ-type ribon-helix-helix transcriptional regulator